MLRIIQQDQTVVLIGQIINLNRTLEWQWFKLNDSSLKFIEELDQEYEHKFVPIKEFEKIDQAKIIFGRIEEKS